MDGEQYVGRIGVDPASVADPTYDALARLQRAHVTSVPFETLSINGHPWGEWAGDGVSLDLEELYEKIVRQRRGGFCYELNGLFGWLLDELGFDVDRVAGRVLNDGEARPPANHLTSIVTLDREYVVDVGLGVPPIYRPLPLDGGERREDSGIAWRVEPSERPDADYVTQYRTGDGTDWTDRYVFRAVPRDLSFVAATCEFLASAPESPFTGDPVLSIGTDSGWAKLTTDEFTRFVDGETRRRSVEPAEWDDLVESTFGIPSLDG